jgi:cold shock CspA family protein
MANCPKLDDCLHIEQHHSSLYVPQIDLWPDDWAASLRTAGRTFRPPLQMIDAQPVPFLGRGSHAPCCERTYDGDWDREVVQRDQGLRLHSARPGGKDVFVHISAVERSGLSGLAEGMKVSYEVQADRRTGKESATNLKIA